VANRRLRVGTRGSDLALWQARHVVDLLEKARHGISCEIIEVSTHGDRDKETPLDLSGGVGFFVKSLELALTREEIDVAVHSLKDMPSRVPSGLALAAIPKRGDPRDALISKSGRGLEDLPGGARVGTGSPRRKAQILRRRPDLNVVGIRGNVGTRLRKLAGTEYDAVILAVAGLVRLGRTDVITQILPPETMLPAAGQGALAVEVRSDDSETRSLAVAERAFLARLGAGCHVPAAGYGVVDQGSVWLRGLVASHDGRNVIRGEFRGAVGDAASVGLAVAEDLLDRGADVILHDSEE